MCLVVVGVDNDGRTDGTAWQAEPPWIRGDCSTASSSSTTTTAHTAHSPTKPHPPSPTRHDPKRHPVTTTNPHYRVRHDRVDDGGSVSLRVNGRMHHIGIGRTHARTRIILLIRNLDIRIIHATTDEILRALTLDPTRSYQGRGKPPGPPPRKTKRSG